MEPTSLLKRPTVNILILMMLLPVMASAQTTFTHIVSFGASLSDPGNAFALTGLQTTPPYSTLDITLIPPAPYAKGGHHFSNGATWIEQFAKQMGLVSDANSAYRGAGSNYAVGGARAHDDGLNFNLSDQVGRYLEDVNYIASSDTLYTLEFGGNDVRDVLVSGNGDILGDALISIYQNIYMLYQCGARKFLVWNVPNLGLSPALSILDASSPGAAYFAGYVSQQFNNGLGDVLGFLAVLDDIEILLFDADQILHTLKFDPQPYGLVEANNACVSPQGPPFQCNNPDEYLFWDGIHPTKTVHGILAQYASGLVLGQP